MEENIKTLIKFATVVIPLVTAIIVLISTRKKQSKKSTNNSNKTIDANQAFNQNGSLVSSKVESTLQFSFNQQ